MRAPGDTEALQANLGGVVGLGSIRSMGLRAYKGYGASAQGPSASISDGHTMGHDGPLWATMGHYGPLWASMSDGQRERKKKERERERVCVCTDRVIRVTRELVGLLGCLG